jgi:hypothetical protein
MKKLNQSLSLFGDVIPPNFFGILSGVNQARNFVLLWELDDYFGDSIDGVNRDEIVQHVDSFISRNNMLDIGAEAYAQAKGHEETVSSASRIRASLFVKDLIDRGWLEEEQIGFSSLERRSDSFVAVFGALKGLVLGQDTQDEYSTALLNIYQIVSLHDSNTYVETIESIKKNREDLVAELKSIDSKIKRFINKALGGPEKGDKELLDNLVIKYRSQPYYRALIHLNEKENPYKLRFDILKGLERYETVDLEDIVTVFVKAKRGDLSGDDYSKARGEYREYVLKILHDTERTIDTLGEQVEAISRRNGSYISSTKEILNFRLNHGKNINGLIDSILRQIKTIDTEEKFDYSKAFEVPFFHQVDTDSLYRSRKVAAKAPKQISVKRTVADSALIEEAKRLSEYQSKFTREAVEDFVIKSMGDKSSIRASEIKVKSIDDALRLLMVPVYGNTEDSAYSVAKPSGNRFNGFMFNMDDFIISRKEKQL